MPTTLFTLAQANLAGGASFNSVPAPGPVAVPAGCLSLLCSLSVSAADQTDPANAVTWTVYAAPPGPAPAGPPPSAGWTALAREVWQGGTYVDHQGVSHPSQLAFEESAPSQFRGGWCAAEGQNLGRTLKVGCSVTSNP